MDTTLATTTPLPRGEVARLAETGLYTTRTGAQYAVIQKGGWSRKKNGVLDATVHKGTPRILSGRLILVNDEGQIIANSTRVVEFTPR